MCTLSWWHKDGSYGVMFNRDESVRRLEAETPAIRQSARCSYISPIDPEGGGTWIWVNRSGLIGCILNNYTGDNGSAPPGSQPVSRGLLLVSLAGHDSLASVQEAVQREDADYRRYRGFYLLFHNGRATALFSWDGRDFRSHPGDELCCPLTTSGYLPEEVRGYRQEQYRLQVKDRPGDLVDNLVRFHCRHDPQRPAHSVLMARPDARTVSFSRILADERQIVFSYAAVDHQQRLEQPLVSRLNRE